MKKYSQLKGERHCLKDMIPLEKPFTLLFDPSSVCNFSCVQCFHSVEGAEELLPKGFMDLEQFRKIVDGLCEWKGPLIKVVRFIGFGEPFVNKKTPDMIRYLKEANVAERIEVTTNGSLITEEVAEQLVDIGLDYVRISIYSAIQERHEKITNSRMNISRIYENIRTLQQIKRQKQRETPFVYIKMLDTFNEEENDAFFQMYSDIADEIAIEKPHNWLDRNEKDYISDLYQSKQLNLDYFNSGQKVCPQPFKMLSIRQNGDVIVCDPDWVNNTKVGNAFEESLEEIWHGKKLKEFWKMQIEGRRWENESCRQCTFLNEKYVLDNIDGISIRQIENW